MEVFDIGGEVTIEMNVASKNNEYFSFDMIDNVRSNTVQSYMTRDKLYSLATFIMKFLENHQ